MFHLLYVSAATHDFLQEELSLILEKSRERNARLDITGVLLYKNKSFMQLLEGDEDAVLALYYRIMLDPRHHKVVTLFKEKILQRDFQDWSMGFQDLNDAALKNLPGYNTMMNLAFSQDESNPNISRCQRLLSMFKNNDDPTDFYPQS